MDTGYTGEGYEREEPNFSSGVRDLRDRQDQWVATHRAHLGDPKANPGVGWRSMNPDVDLRELERRFKQSGSVEDEVAYLNARLRAGSLSHSRLLLAAALEHPAAKRIVPPKPPGLPKLSPALGGGEVVVTEVRTMDPYPGHRGLSGFADVIGRGPKGSDDYAVRCIIAIAESLVPILKDGIRWPSNLGPDVVLRRARQWANAYSTGATDHAARSRLRKLRSDVQVSNDSMNDWLMEQGSSYTQDQAVQVFEILTVLISGLTLTAFLPAKDLPEDSPMYDVARSWEIARESWADTTREADFAWRDVHRIAHGRVLDHVRKEVVPWLLG
jgi:hypothetical protein